MMRRKKKVDPNAPPPPPRDNGLPPKPEDLAAAKASLQEQMGAQAHVATGFGFGDLSSRDRTGAWRLYVFTDDVNLDLPAEHAGYPVERRGVPAAAPPGGNGRGRHRAS